VLFGIGLLVAISSAVIGLLVGDPLFTGQWIDIPLPGGDYIHLGTPLIFDVGVYLTVLGATLTMILTLAEED
jgi:multicomponent Na+:H+ antiporter subunit B